MIDQEHAGLEALSPENKDYHQHIAHIETIVAWLQNPEGFNSTPSIAFDEANPENAWIIHFKEIASASNTWQTIREGLLKTSLDPHLFENHLETNGVHSLLLTEDIGKNTMPAEYCKKITHCYQLLHTFYEKSNELTYLMQSTELYQYQTADYATNISIQIFKDPDSCVDDKISTTFKGLVSCLFEKEATRNKHNYYPQIDKLVQWWISSDSKLLKELAFITPDIHTKVEQFKSIHTQYKVWYELESRLSASPHQLFYYHQLIQFLYNHQTIKKCFLLHETNFESFLSQIINTQLAKYIDESITDYFEVTLTKTTPNLTATQSTILYWLSCIIYEWPELSSIHTFTSDYLYKDCRYKLLQIAETWHQRSSAISMNESNHTSIKPWIIQQLQLELSQEMNRQVENFYKAEPIQPLQSHSFFSASSKQINHKEDPSLPIASSSGFSHLLNPQAEHNSL